MPAIEQPPSPLHGDNQLVTVVIATRNRGVGVVRTIESIFCAEHPRFGEDLELIIVDQSDDDTTECAVIPYRERHVRYFRTPPRGLGAARNVGIAAARS